MKHARAAEFANYLEANVPDREFRMSDSSMCIMGHVNNRAGTGFHSPHYQGPGYWDAPVKIFGNETAAKSMYLGINYYGGVTGAIKTWFYSLFGAFTPQPAFLRVVDKQQAVRVIRRYAETGNVVWR